MKGDIIVVNTEFIPGQKVTEALGLVKGSAVQSKWFGKDIIAGLRNIVGGELKEYTEMLNEARDMALARMIEDAKKLKADAILNVRFTTSQIAESAAEIVAYGTAVKTKDDI